MATDEQRLLARIESHLREFEDAMKGLPPRALSNWEVSFQKSVERLVRRFARHHQLGISPRLR